MLFILHVAVVLATADGLHTASRASALLKSGAYSFDDFVRDFAREYRPGSEEYLRRAAIFRDSLSQVNAINSRLAQGSGSWTAGVYPFMDWSGAERSERLHGLVPSASRRGGSAAAGPGRPFAGLQAARDSAGSGRGLRQSFEAEAPAVQDQNALGNCGSCWAFAAVEAVEAQLMRSEHRSALLPDGEPRLSVQALLDCVPRQKSCAGGCRGSHPDLAFDFMRRHGLPLESALPYDPAQTGKCPIEAYPQDWVRVTLTGWQELPRNQAQPLMQALVESGPAVVSADSRTWYPYRSGVFDGCPQDPDPNHSVLARGYGSEGGRKYWLLQNSWGTQWGEAGSIRISRHDDEGASCGTARDQDGDGCDSEHKANVTVCGSCGFLGYSPLIPKVGYVMLGPGPSGVDLELADSGSDAASLSAAATDDPQRVGSGLGDTSLRPPRAGPSDTHPSFEVAQHPPGGQAGQPQYNETPGGLGDGQLLSPPAFTDGSNTNIDTVQAIHVKTNALVDSPLAAEGEAISSSDSSLGDYLRR